MFPDQRSSHLGERRGRRQEIRWDQTQRDRRHEKRVEGARNTTRAREEENSIKGVIEGKGCKREWRALREMKKLKKDCLKNTQQ